MADLSQGLTITNDTKFNLGSNSKQFLGYAFALLDDRGIISLDDPVSKYVEGWPDFEYEVTLRHMLTHTSGTRSAYDMVRLEGLETGKHYLPRRKAYEAIRQQEALDFVPGSKYMYNSMAFTIMADVLETVTDKPAEEWMRENIFTPLKMNDTVIETKVGQFFPGLAESYSKNGGSYLESHANRAIFGAADIITTMDDMSKWADNLLHAKLGGEDVQQTFAESFILNDGEELGYGLGISVYEWRGLNTYTHRGSHAGFRSLITAFPEIDAAIILLSNNSSLNATRWEVAEWFFDDHLADEKAESENPIVEKPRIDVDAKTLEQYTGHYLRNPEDHTGAALNYIIKDGILHYQINYLSPYFPLYPVGEHLFYDPQFNSNREFIFSGDTVFKKVATFYDQKIEYRKVRKWNPSPKELASFAGDYINPETKTVFTLEVSDGKLVANHRWHEQRTLKPLSKDIFFGFHTINQIEFFRDEEGSPVAFKMYDKDTIPIRFEKIKRMAPAKY